VASITPSPLLPAEYKLRRTHTAGPTASPVAVGKTTLSVTDGNRFAVCQSPTWSLYDLFTLKSMFKNLGLLKNGMLFIFVRCSPLIFTDTNE